jgi:hypothetical protein
MKRLNLGTGAALLVGAACFALVSGEAAPASGAAARTVTITLTNSGKARWSIDGDAEKGSLAMNYSWRGTLRFKVPAKAVQSPGSRFLSTSAGTLRAAWTGDATGTKFGAPFNGPYHCQYVGKDVPSKVTATLTNGRVRGTLEVTLHAKGEEGFFPSKGSGATVNCSSGYGVDGPAHFEPQWLFRDTTSDYGRMTSDTAVIALPVRALNRGSVTLKWPREIGSVSSPLRAKLAWNNVGKLVAKTS